MIRVMSIVTMNLVDYNATVCNTHALAMTRSGPFLVACFVLLSRCLVPGHKPRTRSAAPRLSANVRNHHNSERVQTLRRMNQHTRVCTHKERPSSSAIATLPHVHSDCTSNTAALDALHPCLSTSVESTSVDVLASASIAVAGAGSL